MNKGLLVGIIVGAVGVTAAGSVASLHYLDQQPQYAEVVSSKAVMEETVIPVEECKTVQVQVQKPVKDEHQIAGTAIGAVVGGVLGNQVGGGNGKKSCNSHWCRRWRLQWQASTKRHANC